MECQALVAPSLASQAFAPLAILFFSAEPIFRGGTALSAAGLPIGVCDARDFFAF